MKFYYILIVAVALLCSCVKDPNHVTGPDPNTNAKQAALILCEGLWGSNNSVFEIAMCSIIRFTKATFSKARTI